MTTLSTAQREQLIVEMSSSMLDLENELAQVAGDPTAYVIRWHGTQLRKNTKTGNIGLSGNELFVAYGRKAAIFIAGNFQKSVVANCSAEDRAMWKDAGAMSAAKALVTTQRQNAKLLAGILCE